MISGTMSRRGFRPIAAAVLLLHGLGHGGALGALAWIQLGPGDAGAWLAARSWLLPSLPGDMATTLAASLWIASMLGFVVAALSFSGVVGPSSLWRPLAVASALVSTVGIVLFLGTWPMFNTLAALGVNAAVLGTILWRRRPPEAVSRV